MTDREPTEPAMLTIGELARFAGVTIRAVRHYHARGLLPEPERDGSGYRRYGAQAVVDLIRIRTLAEAGVPLARVGELLLAEPAEFDEAIEDIDRRLQEEIRRLKDHRTRITQLAAGENLVLPPEAVAYLDRLRAIGISERMIDIERDGWILLSAHSPDLVVEWVNEKHQAFEDEGYCDLYRTFDQAYSWDPSDPRLDELADTLSAYIRRLLDEQPGLEESDEADAESIVALLDSQTSTSPAWRRLLTLVQERGLSGWTAPRPTDED